jgi:hypothetical protein
MARQIRTRSGHGFARGATFGRRASLFSRIDLPENVLNPAVGAFAEIVGGDPWKRVPVAL